MSIVDRTYTVPGETSSKSSPTQTNRSPTSSPNKKPFSVASLINKKSQSARQENSEKTPSGLAGYELVKKPSVNKAPVGYELVGGSPGKKGSSRMNQDDLTGQTLVEHKKKCQNVVFYVAIAVLVVITIALVIGVIFLIKSVVLVEIPLPNLTDLCQEESPSPQVDRDCYFHLNKYADSCKSTVCQTIAINVKYETHQGISSLKYELLSNKTLTKLPDETPCGPDKWCQDSICIKTNDNRIKKYAEMKPINGSWRNRCKDKKCVVTTKFIKFDPYFEKCSGCHNRASCSTASPYLFRLGYRSCDDPLPSHGGTFCWSAMDEMQPIYIAENCKPCRNDSQKLQGNCDCKDKNIRDPTGYKCVTDKNEGGLCAGNKCVLYFAGNSTC